MCSHVPMCFQEEVLTTFIPNGSGQVVFMKHAKIVALFYLKNRYSTNFDGMLLF